MPSRQDAQQSAQPVVRKAYAKPKIEQVRLVLEEAVLGTGCKTTTQDGPHATGPCEVAFQNCLTGGS